MQHARQNMPGAALACAAIRMPGNDIEEHDDIEEPQAKRNQPLQLPSPLTEQLLSQAMRELNQGTARAVESCLQCYHGKRMSGDDLLSFTHSIAVHSATLSALFHRKTQQVVQSEMSEAVGVNNLAALIALAGAPAPALAPFPATHHAHVPAPPSMPAANLLPIFFDPVSTPSTKPVVPRTRKAKVSKLSNEVLLLVQRWCEKRVTEIARRQHETAKCKGVPSATGRNAAYVRFLMGKLKTTLPAAGNLMLLDYVRTFNATKDVASFSERVKDLVDVFNVKISLSYPLECTVRAALAPNARAFAAAAKQAATESSAVVAIDIDSDLHFSADGCGPSVHTANGPASSDHSQCLVGCSHGSNSLPGKRKRTKTLNGAHPKDEDDMACCPVCQNETRDDDRWVKCDGCGNWYHQICVLFNAIAHGKSVRFFCWTPGCRKRGSRQLNRRQRKPFYPTSMNIDSSLMTDTMTTMVQRVARGNRDVIIKMVANVESVLEVKNSRACRKSVERCRMKTICALQHSLIGSDLLFMIMFVKEIVGPDGVGHIEICRADVNGFYEELQHNEAANIEKAIIQSYLSHAANHGFASARVHVGDKQRCLFLGVPSSHSATASADSCMDVLEEARNLGLVYSFQQERCSGPHSAVLVQLLDPSSSMSCTVAIERDSDIACPVAQTMQDWIQVQEHHRYQFDDLQFAKFSSMMLIYHVIKGWNTTLPCHITAPMRASPASAYHETPAPAGLQNGGSFMDTLIAKPHRQCDTINSNPDHQHEQAGQLSLFDESLSNDVELKPMSAGEGCKDQCENTQFKNTQQQACLRMVTSDNSIEMQGMPQSMSFQDFRAFDAVRKSVSQDLPQHLGTHHSSSFCNMHRTSIGDVWADMLGQGEQQQQSSTDELFCDSLLSSL